MQPVDVVQPGWVDCLPVCVQQRIGRWPRCARLPAPIASADSSQASQPDLLCYPGCCLPLQHAVGMATSRPARRVSTCRSSGATSSWSCWRAPSWMGGCRPTGGQLVDQCMRHAGASQRRTAAGQEVQAVHGGRLGGGQLLPGLAGWAMATCCLVLCALLTTAHFHATHYAGHAGRRRARTLRSTSCRCWTSTPPACALTSSPCPTSMPRPRWLRPAPSAWTSGMVRRR